LKEEGFFKEEELEAYKRGRNHISHIPKNGDLSTYECASGLEAICGYLYLTDKERLKLFFEKVFEGGVHNE
jgi:ribonuclease-3 family protein